ncbi:hypothetical protein EON82_05935 [bacterium]|nr:MAG: hypothetical protein EON82_05935 [bacterium]
MPSRFDQTPEEPVLLTPEVAERVVELYAERQAERQRAEALERERQASMTRIQELADLLGTTPDEVKALAKEAQSTVPVEAEESEYVYESAHKAEVNWRLHGVYWVAIFLLIVWLWPTGTTPAVPAPQSTPTGYLQMPGGSPVLAIHFDPYSRAYVRDITSPDSNRARLYLVDQAIKAPPAGAMVSLVTPGVKKMIVGAPGRIKDDLKTAEELRASIRSLLAFEESQEEVNASLPTTGYNDAPFLQDDSRFSGEPRLVGWHVVEVSNGRSSYRGLVPDRRYAKDLAAYEKAMKSRLEQLTDAKFFPSQPPANLRPHSIRFDAPLLLPKGTSLIVWNGSQTFWTQGTASAMPAERMRTALDRALADATQKLVPTMNGTDALGVMLLYPGGERYEYWSLDDAKGVDSGGHKQRRESSIDAMVKTALAAMTKSR